MIETAVGFLRRHSQTNWALADQAMVSGANFLTGILLARGLGIAGFGRFSLAWLAVGLVQSIQENAITAPMMSIGPKQDERQRPIYFGGVFLQQAILALVSMVLTWACFRFAGGIIGTSDPAPLAASVAAAVLLCQMQDFLRRYFFTRDNPVASFATDAVRYTSQLVILFWVFVVSKTANDASTALWIIAASSGAGALLVLILVDKLEWTTAGLRYTTLRNWRFSRWLVGSAIVQWTSSNVFIVAAAALLGVTAVGALKAAQSLIGVTHIFFQGLENIAPIRASQRFHAGGATSLVQYIARVTRLGLAATLIIGLFFAIRPAFWFALLFGEDFTQYSYLVRWYAGLYAVMFLALPVRFGLRALERTVPIFIAYAAAAAFSLAAAYPLVRAFGVTGVLVGFFATQVLMLVIMATALRLALRMHSA
jgi:O-antigen/teichoic acid export membrane protein